MKRHKQLMPLNSKTIDTTRAGGNGRLPPTKNDVWKWENGRLPPAQNDMRSSL